MLEPDHRLAKLVVHIDELQIAFRAGPAQSCPADLDCSGAVDFGDLLAVLSAWGPYEPCPPFRPEDLDRLCSVDFADILFVLARWGACPG